MASVLLGNGNPREWDVTAGAYQTITMPFGQLYTVTLVPVPSGISNAELAQTIYLPGGIWERHSSDTAPLWVGSDDSSLASTVSALFGGLTVNTWTLAKTLAAAVGVDWL